MSKKRFKSSKKINISFLKLIIFCLIIFFSLFVTVKYLLNKSYNIKMTNSVLVNYLLNSSTNNMLMKDYNLKKLIEEKITNPNMLYKFSLNDLIHIDDDIYVYQDLDEITDYIEDPNPEIIKDPIVYIYNTHQLENYQTSLINPYNIAPNVMVSSYILRENLNKLGIKTIVETNDVSKVIKENNWTYASSYRASRTFLDKIIKEEPTLKYFIDIHRDSSIREKTTTEIDGKYYARLLFVVGLEHKNYQKNLDLTTLINKKLIKYNKTLSRGIYKKSGEGVNGIYNQDFNENTILIEVGGQYNTIEEVNNTLDVLDDILFEIIKERG